MPLGDSDTGTGARDRPLALNPLMATMVKAAATVEKPTT
jgi:hypothetical protein